MKVHIKQKWQIDKYLRARVCVTMLTSCFYSHFAGILFGAHAPFCRTNELIRIINLLKVAPFSFGGVGRGRPIRRNEWLTDEKVSRTETQNRIPGPPSAPSACHMGYLFSFVKCSGFTPIAPIYPSLPFPQIPAAAKVLLYSVA